MRKASQDAGDTTSITSGLDGEGKKSGPGIMKTKRSSIKRKVQSFSHESDDAVIEPLLQKDKEKSEIAIQSAKFLLKKTDSISEEKVNDKDKLLADNTIEKPSISCVPGITDKPPLSNGINDSVIAKSYVSTVAPIYNHMNTNVFSSHDVIIAPKTQILVEIDGNKSSGYNPSPLIFTTARIHTDSKIKQMEQVQMTPLPILSTNIEGSVIKIGSTSEYDKHTSILSKNIIVSTKPSEKDEISRNVSTFSPCSTSSNFNNDVPVVLAVENKGQNVFNKITAATTSASYISQSLDINIKTSVTACTEDNAKNKITSPNLNSSANVKLNNEPFINTKPTLSDSIYIPISETIQTSITHKDNKYIKTFSEKQPALTKAEDVSNIHSQTSSISTITANGKISFPVNKDNKIDVNKNFEIDLLSQKPGTSNNVKLPLTTKAESSNIDTDTRKLSIKLQRQKKSQIEDIQDPDPNTKSSVGQLQKKTSSAGTKELNQIEGFVQSTTTNKQNDSEAAKNINGQTISKTFSTDKEAVPKTSTLVTKTTASSNTTQTITSKPYVTTTTSANSSVFNVSLSSFPIKSSIPVVTSSVNKMHSQSVATFKSPGIISTAACNFKPTTIAKCVSANTTTNANNTTKTSIATNAKPIQNVSTNKITTGSSTKPKISSTSSQPGVSAKTTVGSTIKSSPTTMASHTSLTKTTTSVIPIQSTSKAHIKTSSTKVMNTSGIKPISSVKAVLPPVVPPASTYTAKESAKIKHGDSKTSNKDPKSFK